jgi:hypothetical protein
MIYELIEKYKLNLCEEVKKYEILGYGSTATVFLNKGKPEFVIKEIYLNSDTLVSNKLRELSNNIFINEDEELRKLAPEFIGFDLCEKKMLLKFKYTGPSLKENITKLSAEKINFIKETVENNIEILNSKGLIHNDLHLGNIFYYKGKVYIGDWGKTITYKIKKEDFELFYGDLLLSIYMGYFFKQNTMTSIKKYMNSKGLYQKAVDDTIKEINYQKKVLFYKPKGFVDKIFPNLLQKNLESVLFLRSFPYVKEHTKLPEDIYEYTEFLRAIW